MASAIPDRTKILATLETLAIGAAGGLLFLWAGLPGGLISGAMFAVGGAGLAGVAATDPAYERLSADNRPARARHLLLDLRQQLLFAAHAWLGPDLGALGRQPRRIVADHHPRRRKGRRRRRYRRGPDHAR